MDAVKCLNEFQRMCESHIRCKNCKISSLKGNWLCKDWSLSHPEELVRIVEEWSKAHPIQTRADKFKEVFGVTVWESIDEGHGDWSKWWDIPYEAPKGEDNDD